jgi:hypothetical protein
MEHKREYEDKQFAASFYTNTGWLTYIVSMCAGSMEN